MPPPRPRGTEGHRLEADLGERLFSAPEQGGLTVRVQIRPGLVAPAAIGDLVTGGVDLV
jgi:hypothetical protein